MLSETRAVDGNYTLGNGHRLFCGRDEFEYARVAILVHARWASSVVKFQKVSGRVVYVDLVVHGLKYRIVAVCVPHAGYAQISFDDCFDDCRALNRLWRTAAGATPAAAMIGTARPGQWTTVSHCV